ncbi:hypothetical protein ANO11243_042680 [Dothideomycetidae sp. 11243]|nr:hypothetical protein ANO11243_042680 [fungal sp. No.11243]
MQKIQLADQKLFRQNAYVGGAWIGAKSGSTFDVLNPASGEVIGTCPEMDAHDTKAAIGVATESFASFQHSSTRQRMEILKEWFNLMMAHKDDLAKILSVENGRPFEAAKAEIDYAASFMEWFQGEAMRSSGETLQPSTPDKRVMIIKQPIGVVGVLTPWNFPSAMITRKVGAAIAAGCSVVLKPAAETPYSALALAELGERAGVPKGVFNVLTTDKHVSEVGKAICEHRDIKKISFTGSTGVGKILMQQSSSTLKKLSMELGGNAPFIVFDDADIPAAVEGLMAAKFRASGQTCVCANRVYVQAGVYDKFVEQFAATVDKSMKAGDPMDSQTTMGPLISAKAVDKIRGLVSDAKENGAKVVMGQDIQDGKNYYPATVLSGMTAAMRASREELFGPVAAFYKFEGEDELFKAANDTDVGLASYIYTSNISRAWRAAEALQTGMVGINTGMISDPVSPFGGIKESGFGREGGREGVSEYQISKTITVGGLGHGSGMR